MRVGVVAGLVGLAVVGCDPELVVPLEVPAPPAERGAACAVALVEAGSTGVRLGCAVGAPGAVVEVPLELISPHRVGGLIVRVAEVPAVDLVEVSLGPDARRAGKSLSVLREFAATSIVVAGLNYAALGDADGDGAAAVARLRYRLPAVPGEAELSLEIVELVGPTGVALFASGHAGTVVVED